jgi:hypothetical protein
MPPVVQSRWRQQNSERYTHIHAYDTTSASILENLDTEMERIVAKTNPASASGILVYLYTGSRWRAKLFRALRISHHTL